jgi:hypothetical protein
MGKLALIRLHDTKPTEVEATKRCFGRSGFGHVSLEFGLMGWIDDGKECEACADMLLFFRRYHFSNNIFGDFVDFW